MSGSQLRYSRNRYFLVRSVFILFAALVVALSIPSGAQPQRPVAGRNVNMVAGTTWPDGDPFLQRQNEPSLAVSTRNPQHLLAGANDYRTIDIPFDILNSEEEKKADAWLGVFKSFDGGNSWKSSLLPGFPQDKSTAGEKSPIHGYEAGADPVVRAGTNGLFYYSGVAFNRASETSAIFVARFIDNNNQESGDSISYIGTEIIVKHPKKLKWFLDKPWMAVDIPRRGAGQCRILGTQVGKNKNKEQSFPTGTVYLAYSAIDPDSPDEASQIMV